MRHFVYGLLLLAVLLVPAPVMAGAAVAVPPGSERIWLSPHLQWLPVPDVPTLADAQAQDAAFVDIVDDANLGRLPGRWWFRLALHNPADRAGDWLLTFGFAQLDHVQVHQVRADGRVESVATGTLLPFHSRPVPADGFIIPVALAAGETSTLYLQVEARMGMALPLTLYSPTALVAAEMQASWWHGLFYGLVLGLLAYNAFLWWSTRDRAFLYFVGTGLTALGYFAGFDGLFLRVLPDAVLFNRTLLFVAGALSVAMTLQFTRYFLDTPRLLARWQDRVLTGFALLALLLAAAVPLLTLDLALTLVLGSSLVMALLMLHAGLRAWRAREPLARVFALVMLIHLTVLVLLGLGSAGAVEGLLTPALQVHRVSLAIILALFSLALGERIKANARARRAAEAEVLQARADARARNEFLAKMSHELRTPMTGVLGMAELLEHTELQPQQRRYLSTLRYSGEMLLNLINDVLDHARIEAGRLQIRREAFDLYRLVDDCRLLFEQQPRDNGVRLRIDLAAGAPRVVVGDAQRIRQVLVNLLSNAFKFTHAGTVTLNIRPLPGGWLRFEVVDTGVGIDAADRERLFSVFTQAAEGRAVRGGSGLGLAICRQLCELMGGRIGVDSVPGQGSLFWFELPLHAAE